MTRVTIHPRATAETVAVARIVIGLTWLVRLIPDPIHRLGHLPPDLWFPRGILHAIPDPIVTALLDPAALTVLRGVAVALAVVVVLGIRPHRFNLAALAAVMVVYLGIGRGFAAHVNHRELVLLYVTVVLVFLPCFDALTLGARRRPADRDGEVYRASMIAICFVIVTSYVFVGVARVAIGFPVVFDPEVMRGWLVSRSLRPNSLGLQLGAAFLDLPVSRYLVPLMLPTSTLLELFAPLALCLRERPRVVLLAALASLHLAIALLMNIVFIENVLLLALFVNYTPWLQGVRRHTRPRQDSVATSKSESMFTGFRYSGRSLPDQK